MYSLYSIDNGKVTTKLYFHNEINQILTDKYILISNASQIKLRST